MVITFRNVSSLLRAAIDIIVSEAPGARFVSLDPKPTGRKLKLPKKLKKVEATVMSNI